jgi:hypothetical protein
VHLHNPILFGVAFVFLPDTCRKALFAEEWRYMHEDNSQDYYRSNPAGRDRYRRMDDLNTRMSQVNPQLPLDEEAQVAGEGVALPLIREVEDFLEAHEEELESAEELHTLLQKLDTAIASTNSVHARELRKLLIETYGTPL